MESENLASLKNVEDEPGKIKHFQPKQFPSSFSLIILSTAEFVDSSEFVSDESDAC
jgi:hypothetical protein